MAKNDDKYTDPELRTEIKERVQASDKGGQPGQWSARKAQMMAQEYKKEMQDRGEEPYKTDKSEKSESQKNLTNWTKEEWQTSDGSANAKQEDGSMKRYLPKKAWENMTEEEKEETEDRKAEGDKEGKQFVSNTEAAKKARKGAQEHEEEDNEEEDAEGEGEEEEEGVEADEKKDTKPPPARGTKNKRGANGDTKNVNGSQTNTEEKNEDEEEKVDNDDDKTDSQPAAKQAKGNKGEKRTTKAKSGTDKNGTEANGDKGGDEDKKNKSNGDDSHGEPGSTTRLPSKGQKVYWRATPGWCEGTVIDIVHSETEINGVHTKASKDDPRIILESAKSGKTASHKPGAVYF